ncbi:MAG: 2,3-bisphosphoglycerate-independent phosphoglycerate mutase [Candidatus Magasanikbacteria bacterium CG_4_9_14_0_2_um_filter_42_11]|uniref:2,3-bisphosphoglycerate-independent phosphoglycerate mutase n=1 Tax=Candidatus Magasanikbacteria bacterium CG_4_9_14_0_2_um_filter_42_11 TaxID=1974643 RepID=A0A2M8FA10_9BACT|nr:MAG: 2,3-bisphosphoglycerate-independent phosphoglycerate mutase [Candidatus Magasanikbacteria bacterium CG_4_10_14_0_8_um_filter_42_12]PJC52565.1 MAG: 2,3-bisphosphoglycerate-independent phosphoglycerate mutase [Candidatus Magasanikbacteria bacterium CG_4_9_14_0_2_um_filter_42_11]
MNRPKPTVLAICDGWGVAQDSEGNAITRAKTPRMDAFTKEYPVMTLYASGNEVGLQFGEMGNSEVGHLNIGAGRVYYQTLPRINKSISDGSFFQNEALAAAVKTVTHNNSTLHVMGLVGHGNVHASQEHLFAILELAKTKKIKNVMIHAFLDGRDSKFDSGKPFVAELEAKMKELGVGKIATLGGRYWGMDRDNRWDRIEKAYKAIALGEATAYFPSATAAIDASYEKKVYDEEFEPVVIGKEGNPTARVSSGDAVIFFNFRPDRARQLTQAFVLPAFEKFQREYIRDVTFVTMTEYEKELPVSVAFPPMVVHNCLAEVLSNAELSQFHIAETEKYAHVTFFLNGTVEDPFPGEDRKIISSPKVSSYDQAPEMSAGLIAKEVARVIEADQYDVIILNFANADMVGHTGDLAATIAGVEAVDKTLGVIADHVLAKDGLLLITADHGNGEEVINLETGDMDKEHSTNPVPFYIISNEYRGKAGPAGDPPEGDLSLMHPVGMLADVAPTMLKLLGVDQPPEMTGRSLM